MASSAMSSSLSQYGQFSHVIISLSVWPVQPCHHLSLSVWPVQPCHHLSLSQSGQFNEDMIPTVGFNMRKVTKGNVTIKVSLVHHCLFRPRPHSHALFPDLQLPHSQASSCLIPRPHSQASSCLIPRSHSQASFPYLIPIPHSQASSCLIPMPHSQASFPCLIPRPPIILFVTAGIVSSSITAMGHRWTTKIQEYVGTLLPWCHSNCVSVW